MVVLALLLPYLTLTQINRAEAQVQVLPTLAVTEFRNLKSPGTTFGTGAATAVADELTKTNKYDMVSPETITRTLQSLGLSSPLDGLTNLMRLAAGVQASTIVTGDVVDYEVRMVPGGKQAFVAMRVVVYDVASALPVNGAALSGQSTIRSSDTSDEILITDAIRSGANDAVRQIQARALPTGTVLNTLPNQALVNQGTRTGFKAGQDVIIVRGREQVGRGKVSSVDPDSSTVDITYFSKGIAPGDKVRVLFTPPDIRGLTATGQPKVVTKRSNKVSSSAVTALLLVGLLAVLLSGANARSQELVEGLKAEPTVDAGTGNAQVLVSWGGNGFVKGNANRVQWQIWRNDVTATPVGVVSGSNGSFNDTEIGARNFDWTYFGGATGGGTCTNEDYNDETAEEVAGVLPGIPYTYQVDLVYAIARIDLPGDSGGDGGTGGDNGGTGGDNGGDNNGGDNGGTGGDNGGTGGGNTGARANSRLPLQTRQGDVCYFVSAKTTSQGTATPIRRPQLSSPLDGQTPATSTFFSVTSPFIQPGSDVNPEYMLQFSAYRDFRKSSVVNVITWSSSRRGVVTTPTAIDTESSSFPAAIRNGDFYWRIGVRNANDRPGPRPDAATGERFVFSIPNLFKRQIQP